MGDMRELKLRRFIGRYVPILAAVCVGCMLAGGALVYTTHVEPGTETQQIVLDEWETNGELSHSATVRNGTTVFPTGTTLADRSAYYTQVTPTVDLELRYGFVAADGELDVDGESTLVIRSVDDEGNELWRTDEQLDSFEETLGPNEEFDTEVSVDVPETSDEIAGIEEELGATLGSVEVAVEHSIAAESSVGGETDVHDQTYLARIEPGGGSYTVETESTGEETHQRTGTVTVERTHGTLRNVSGPLLIIVGLLGLSGVAAGRHYDAFELTDAEKRNLEFADTRSELDEWISRARTEGQANGDERLRAETLEDLVDIAIDTDERVIEDVEKRLYYVLDGQHRYVYQPDPEIDIRRFER